MGATCYLGKSRGGTGSQAGRNWEIEGGGEGGGQGVPWGTSNNHEQ